MVKKHHYHETELIEKNIIDATRYTNNAAMIAENILNKRMKNITQDLMNKYDNNKSVQSWDMIEIKNKISPYNFYVINEDLKIITATLESDIGLNLSTYEAFAQLLRKRLQGSQFKADRLDISLIDKKLKKYSYMPTPDNKFLFEVSIDTNRVFPGLEKLNFLQLAKDLQQKYEILNDITFYKFNENANQIGMLDLEKTTAQGYSTDIQKGKIEIIRKVVNENKLIEQSIAKNKQIITKNKFVPLLYYDDNGKTNWWNSYVMEFTYDNSILKSEISKQKNKLIITITLITIIFAAFTIIIKKLFDKTEAMAYYDHLTNLPNRKFFEKKFNNIISNSANGNSALFFIDLDKFKEVNDTHGHETGDYLLIEIGERLRENLRKNDIVSRLGGDEFIIVLNRINHQKEAESVAQKLINLLEEPFYINENKINIEASIGISLYPDDGTNTEELLNKADIAMYHAKKQNTNYKFYNKQGEKH